MSVRVTLDKSQPPKAFSWDTVTYPHLGTFPNGGPVILFTALGYGIVIQPTGGYKVGDMSGSWYMKNIVPLVGGITLSND